jgi:hypothetical protein
MASTVGAVDDRTASYRGEIARRLKAGRWLVGGLEATGKGRTPIRAKALSLQELAARPGMAENEITASLLGTIERMERHTTPMQLTVIGQALGLGDEWFAPAIAHLEMATQRERDQVELDVDAMLDEIEQPTAPPLPAERTEAPPRQRRRGA